MTKGARKLKELVSPKVTQEELSAKLGVTQQSISSWIVGRAKPTPERMAVLEDLLGIPMRDWTEEDEGSETTAAE
jgi:ribosome-binding protein aMBF1 (putative translation factor)